MLRKKFKFSPSFYSRTKPIMCKIARQEDVVFANYLAQW